MPDIFDEVADDLRAENTRRFLIRYAGVFIGGALLVLIGVGAFQAWRWHQHRLEMRAGAQYLAITSRIDAAGTGLTKATRLNEAKTLLNFAKSAPAGYATLARFRAAALYADAGAMKQAEALWTRIGSSGHAGPLMRDLATLLWAQHAMGITDPNTVMARLQPVMNPANPMHDMAQLLGAVVDLRIHQEHAAKSLLERVSIDPEAPPGVRNLADGLLAKLNG
ncbi:MAG TPA: tetratricopeptide repeat protein [Acetobacteraceae bacterium]|nr:tetratricopeptide repeat protein [Acetobacteraceae bacterium]